MDDCPITFNTSVAVRPNIVPVDIEWSWALDVLSIAYTFTPEMNDVDEPAGTDFIVKHGTTPVVFVSASWTSDRIWIATYTHVGAPSLPISTIYGYPSTNFETEAGQWVAKFQDLDVSEIL